MAVQLLGVDGLPEIAPDDDLASMIHAAADLGDGDVVVVTSKVVSKAEGRTVELAEVDAVRVRRRMGGPLGQGPAGRRARAGGVLTHRAHGRAGPDHRNPPWVRVRQQRRRPELERSRRSSGAAARRLRTRRPAGSAPASPSWASTSPSSSATRSDGRGARARPMSPSASPASPRCARTSARSTPTATSSGSRSCASSTSWRRPPSWSRATPAGYRSPSCAATRASGTTRQRWPRHPRRPAGSVPLIRSWYSGWSSMNSVHVPARRHHAVSGCAHIVEGPTDELGGVTLTTIGHRRHRVVEHHRRPVAAGRYSANDDVAVDQQGVPCWAGS